MSLSLQPAAGAEAGEKPPELPAVPEPPPEHEKAEYNFMNYALFIMNIYPQNLYDVAVVVVVVD